jgi:hypothetical protein
MTTRRVKTGGAYISSGGLGAPSPPQWQNTYEDRTFVGSYVADPGGGPAQYQYSSTGAGVSNLLLESNSNLLLEDGFVLLME